jgi:hypothetical protein
MAQKFFFAGTVLDRNGNTGLEELKARFTTGASEGEAKSLANAFMSAAGKPGLRVNGGVALWNAEQLGQRIAAVSGKAEQADNLAQFRRGAEALEHAVAAPTVSAAAPARIAG